MKKFWISTSILLFILGCGSGRKLASNPLPLGVVLFSGSQLSSNTQDINSQLLTALNNSGNFTLEVLDTMPAFWDLADMETRTDTVAKWILTGKIDYEEQDQSKGTKIPYLFYTPASVYELQLTYRLYAADKNGWADIHHIKVQKKHKGNATLLEFDPSDPSLALNAKDRQLLRKEAYNEAFDKMIKEIASQMNIK